MKLKEFLNEEQLAKIGELKQKEIAAICVKSEKCIANSMFFCFDGRTHVAEESAREALKKGASVLVSERPLELPLSLKESNCEKNDDIEKSGVVCLVVENARDFLTEACKIFYDNPQKKLKTIAVVGTNGKTSVCGMIKSMLCGSGTPCGAIGTFGASYGEKIVKTGMTTPDAPELYAILSDMIKSGMKAVCMELSAHAIFYKRADFTFDAVVFTNCSEDHLDFFKSYEEYRDVKISAFSQKKSRIAVVNCDDEAFPLIAASRKHGLITYGIENPSDVFAMDIEAKEGGSEFVMNLFDAVFRIKSSLIGKFNVYNMLAAATVCALFGVKTAKLARLLNCFMPISGRMERVCLKRRVYVDYAHTPDGLKKALIALRESNPYSRLICVFGCGGNRDKQKRPIMGEISGKYADFTIITSDNPRYEEPLEIISQIESGIRKSSLNYIIISDRAQAIKYAVDISDYKDVVLIAGKGAEEYQEIMGAQRRFLDKEVACAFLGNDDE